MNLENISVQKKYLNELITLLENITYHFKPGYLYLILGEENTGKTTLLSVLGLLEKIQTGTYYIENINTSKLSSKERAKLIKSKIGFLFPGGYLHHELTVKENLLLALKNPQKIETELEKENLSSLKDVYPLKLSEYQKIQIGFIRCLLNNPTYILADEPDINLEENDAKNVLLHLKELTKKGYCVILSSKNKEHKKYADKVLCLVDKNIQEVQP